MTAQPGTRAYYDQIMTDLAAARTAAGLTPTAAPLPTDPAGMAALTFNSIAAEIAFGDSAAYHPIHARIVAHNNAIDAARQTQINARQAAATQAASCNSCFTIHAGDCY